MDLHEYQAKERFAQFGIPTPQGGAVATTAEEAAKIAEKIGGVVVVKAQVHAGGRGKAGGVKVVKSPAEARDFADSILNKLSIKDHLVRKVLVDPGADIQGELYLAITNDRSARKPLIMASAEGGMDIEEVNRVSPEKIIRIHVDPLIGLKGYQIIRLAAGIQLPRELWKQFHQVVNGLYECYVGSGATLCEINPLALVKEDGAIKLMALDGKMSIDNNALISFPALESLRDSSEEPEQEILAREADLNYVKLDGQIGCMVNGAGLAMATMDMVAHFGEADGIMPANFLDVAGGAGADKVATALKIILDDPNVKAILINIFGGITRCDDVARGIVSAFDIVKTDLPMVVRLSGTNQEEGLKIISDANLPNVSGAASFYEAAQKVVEIAKGA